MRPTEVAKILIVDDEPNIRLMLRTALESEGYQVREAADGRAALDAVAAHAPHLMVLDLNMPVLDGMAVLEQLRALPGKPPPKASAKASADAPAKPPRVVVLTAYGSIARAVRATRLGALGLPRKARLAGRAARHDQGSPGRRRAGGAAGGRVRGRVRRHPRPRPQGAATGGLRRRRVPAAEGRRPVGQGRRLLQPAGRAVRVAAAVAAGPQVLRQGDRGRQAVRARPAQHAPLLRALHVRPQRPAGHAGRRGPRRLVRPAAQGDGAAAAGHGGRS